MDLPPSATSLHSPCAHPKGFQTPAEAGHTQKPCRFYTSGGVPPKTVAKKSYKYIKYNIIICHQPGSTNLPPALLQPPP